jgi:hypothetical protein
MSGGMTSGKMFDWLVAMFSIRNSGEKSDDDTTSVSIK